MKLMVKGAGLVALLMAVLVIRAPAIALAAKPTVNAAEAAGSVIVFPKFLKGTVVADGVTSARTEIEIDARCPNGATCAEAEPVTISFHWVCPGSEDAGAKYVCKESDFNIAIPINGKAVFNPEDPKLAEKNPGSIAPCQNGYLIGWVISPATGRPIKFDALTGSAVLRDGGGAIQSYQAFTIEADLNLAARAEIATDIDARTGVPALVFDGGPGHYQAVAGAVPANLEFHKLAGPLASREAFLILLTLDVRVNRPNYPTFVDFGYSSEQGDWAKTGRNFTCWGELQHPNIDANFTLAGARTGDRVVLSGEAIKVPFGGISDVPGPVTLLGLIPGEEGGRLTMDPAYVVQKPDSSKPTTVFVPFSAMGFAVR
jgi:hypothetical protein